MPRRMERRDDQRELSLLRIGCLLFDDRRELCLVRNISAGGALVRTYSAVSPGSPVALELKQGESVSGVVRWVDGNMAGIMFRHAVDIVAVLAASSEWPRPRQPRVEVRAPVWLRQGYERFTGETVDLSQGGVKIRSPNPVSLDGEVHIRLRGLPELRGFCRWIAPETFGLEFRETLPLRSLVQWVREQQMDAGSDSRAEGATA